MKVSVIGAGNVGSTCLNILAQKNAASELVLLDIKKGIAEGKALDLWQSAGINRFNSRPIGVTNDYEATQNSDVVVITSGFPRKEGMSRDDLIESNSKIVKDVTDNIVKYSPDTTIIVVANPLDVMTYQAYLTSKLPKNRVMGMAGVLDTGRFRSFLAQELKVNPKDIHAILLGGHGDSMVPLPRYTTVSGIPVTELIDKKTLDKIIEMTKFAGGELVKYIGTSAWYAPGSAAARMAEAITRNQKRVLPCCVKLEGEYGLHDVFVGVPIVLGRKGVEQIIELQLNDEEKEMLYKSAKGVKEMMGLIDKSCVVA